MPTLAAKVSKVLSPVVPLVCVAFRFLLILIRRSLTQEHGVRGLIYSGDHDLCVPHTGSEAWTRDLNLEVISPWAPWLVDDQQVAGYSVEYSGLSYVTIKGAGHMVPQTKPAAGFAMFKRFLKGVKQSWSAAEK